MRTMHQAREIVEDAALACGADPGSPLTGESLQKISQQVGPAVDDLFDKVLPPLKGPFRDLRDIVHQVEALIASQQIFGKRSA